MFIGHFAVGFAARRFAPGGSETVLLSAPLLAIMLWPVFLLLGWEQVRIDPGNTRFTPFDFVSYPWSHSLLMLCVWATAFGAIYYAITRYWAGAIAIGIGVVSHWVLDWITHRPYMPIYRGGTRYGLGLWSSIAGTMVVKILMFVAGVWIYVRATRAKDRTAPQQRGSGMIVIRLGAVAALAVVLYGQSKPKDVDGWDKIKWGMTMADARLAYGIDTQPESRDNWTLLQLNPTKMGNVEVGVQVGARTDSGKIASVRLWSFFGAPNSAPNASPQDFDKLRTLLIQKYGHPANEEVTRGDNNHLVKTVLWKFPSTSIVMTLEQSAILPNVGTIYIEYTANPS